MKTIVVNKPVIGKPIVPTVPSNKSRIFVPNKDIFTEEFLQKKGLNERQRKAVTYVKVRGKITNKEYRELTGLSDEGARIDLKKLIKSGIFQIRGEGRKTHYILKKLAISWRLLGDFGD